MTFFQPAVEEADLLWGARSSCRGRTPLHHSGNLGVLFETRAWVEVVNHVVEAEVQPLAYLKIVCDVLNSGLAVHLMEVVAAVSDVCWKRNAAGLEPAVVGLEVVAGGGVIRQVGPELKEEDQKP